MTAQVVIKRKTWQSWASFISCLFNRFILWKVGVADCHATDMTADDRWYFLQLLVWRWEWSFILYQFRKLKALLFLFKKTMKFLIFLLLLLITSVFGIFLESNCNSGRDCRPVTNRECVSPPCFLFFGKYRTTTISQGKCINFDNGPSCRGFPFNGKCKYSLYWIIMPQLHHCIILGGNNCIIRRCVECYTGSHCWQQGNGLVS